MDKIQLFENQKIRTAWDAETEEWYFSVQNIVAVLTNSVDAKDYIKKMKKRDPELNSNWGTICPLVEMQAADVPFDFAQGTKTRWLSEVEVTKGDKQ